MAVITLSNQNLVIATPQTFLPSDTAAGVTTLTVANTSGFENGQVIIIGVLGNEKSEIAQLNSVVDNTTITLNSGTSFPHSASSVINVVQYDYAEFSTAVTTDGSKTTLATIPVWADNLSTNYIDNTVSSGYYFGRFYNSISGTFSSYSSPIPVEGYGIYSARAIIDGALGEINKQTSEVLTDQFAFQMLDAFQTDVLKELKRWSFMQQFDANVGKFRVGEWRIAMPSDINDPDTNKSIYNIRVGTNGRLAWVDKAKWDDLIFNLAYTTLAADVNLGDTTMTLTDSSDFNFPNADNTNAGGTVVIGANTYTYTDNDPSTGILTLDSAITSANTATAGQDVFQNANQGLPEYFTVFGGYFYYWPITSLEYDQRNAWMDYYLQQSRILTDSDTIIVPDPLAASYFLQWKFLKKMNNGNEDVSSTAAQNNYIARREKLKSKEVLNRNFKLHARFQNFAIQEGSDSGDPRFIRDGNFPNTGF